MKKSLYSQTFAYLIFSLLLVVAILSSLFFFSIRRSVALWNVNRGQRLESLLLPLLTRSYREEGRLEETAIHQTLSPFLTGNVFAYVFDADRKPVYIYYNGGRVPYYDTEEMQLSLERLSDRERPLTAVVGSGEVIGYLAADTLGFSHDAANRSFLQTVFSFLGLGMGIAVFIALITSFVFSRILAGEARSVAAGLQRLTRGEREVEFLSPEADEMRAIASSARELQRRLQQEEDMRRQWADDVAHDLRTPVSALKVQLEGLADGVLAPSAERFKSLYLEVGRIESLVNDLRELNRVESPELSLEIGEIELAEFLSGFKALMPPLDRDEEELEVICHVETCRADRHYLSRALTNGIQNALVHGSRRGSIILEVDRKGGETVFDLSNIGRVDPELTERIFYRLYRGSKSRTEPGSGLGLPIVRAIMRAHGGEARVCQQGERTHLLLTLPDSPEQLLR